MLTHCLDLNPNTTKSPLSSRREPKHINQIVFHWFELGNCYPSLKHRKNCECCPASLNCQITMIVMNSGSQLSEMSTFSQVHKPCLCHGLSICHCLYLWSGHVSLSLCVVVVVNCWKRFLVICIFDKRLRQASPKCVRPAMCKLWKM